MTGDRESQQISGTFSLLDEKKIRQSAAERMRAYRRRRRYDLHCVQVQVGRVEVDGLVANGYLPPDKARDLHAIGLAVNDLLFDWLQHT